MKQFLNTIAAFVVLAAVSIPIAARADMWINIKDQMRPYSLSGGCAPAKSGFRCTGDGLIKLVTGMDKNQKPVVCSIDVVQSTGWRIYVSDPCWYTSVNSNTADIYIKPKK